MINRIKSICFVDDDEDDHFLMRNILVDLFPNIVLNEFYTCDELLHFLHNEENLLPDVIILDQNLPRLTGTQCLQKVKSTARLLHIPVIIYSTGGSERDREDARLYGAYKYLLKPRTVQESRKLIGGIIAEVAAQLAG